jgi:hypothetical protein
VNGVSNSNQGTTSVSYSSYCKVVSCKKKKKKGTKICLITRCGDWLLSQSSIFMRYIRVQSVCNSQNRCLNFPLQADLFLPIRIVVGYSCKVIAQPYLLNSLGFWHDVVVKLLYCCFQVTPAVLPPKLGFSVSSHSRKRSKNNSLNFMIKKLLTIKE